MHKRLAIPLALMLLTAACARVNPHVLLPDLQLGEPSFFPTLEAYTSAPITGRNAVDFLLNGEEIFPALIEAVHSARKSITYAQYFFEDGPVARELVEAFAERCRAGVGASILLDAFGSLDMPAEHIERMKSSGCHVVMFRPLSPLAWNRSNKRNHRRILVVDGRLGFTGGSGVSRKWMGNGRVENHWRDTDVRVRGPIVEYLQGAFAENWLEATGVALGGPDYFPWPIEARGSVESQIVRSSPAGGSVAMYTMFLLAMASARRTIYITNPYFVPDDKMIGTLVQARQRGVRVVLLLPGAIDHNLVRQASRSQLGRLLQAGVQVYEYRAALLHSKTMVIDSMWATVGSTNLDRRSFELNEELNLVVYNGEIARRLERVFVDDLERSRQITYEQWKNRGIVSRVLEMLALPIRGQL